MPHTGLGRAASALGCLSRAVAATVMRPFHPRHSKGTNALMERSMDCSARRAWSARKAQLPTRRVAPHELGSVVGRDRLEPEEDP